jgi:hypothetical protein
LEASPWAGGALKHNSEYLKTRIGQSARCQSSRRPLPALGGPAGARMRLYTRVARWGAEAGCPPTVDENDSGVWRSIDAYCERGVEQQMKTSAAEV